MSSPRAYVTPRSPRATLGSAQRLHYDLPWNPNRIEQRFGRIHRIGQQDVCHLWNMVAIETREGEVFQRPTGT